MIVIGVVAYSTEQCISKWPKLHVQWYQFVSLKPLYVVDASHIIALAVLVVHEWLVVYN